MSYGNFGCLESFRWLFRLHRNCLTTLMGPVDSSKTWCNICTFIRKLSGRELFVFYQNF